MKETLTEATLLAYCGVYCGAYERYIDDDCKGCRQTDNTTWCKVKACCIEHNYSTCADCTITDNIASCSKLIETYLANVHCLSISKHSIDFVNDMVCRRMHTCEHNVRLIAHIFGDAF